MLRVSCILPDLRLPQSNQIEQAPTEPTYKFVVEFEIKFFQQIGAFSVPARSGASLAGSANCKISC